MAQNLLLKVAGLHTYFNQLSEVPKGALKRAKNIVIDRNSIAEPRRGFGETAQRLPGTSFRAERFFAYKDKTLVRYNSDSLAFLQSSVTSFSGDISSGSPSVIQNITNTTGLFPGLKVTSTNLNDNIFITSVTSSSATLTANGTPGAGISFEAAGWQQITDWTFGDPSVDFKSRAARANSNLYITTDEGVKKLDTVENVNITGAGAPRAIETVLDVVASSTTGFLSSGGSVAYRTLWGYEDLNQNLILGFPSERRIVTNSTSSSRDITFQLIIPDGVDTRFFYQVYRSEPVNSSLDVEPSDELNLVYEAGVSLGEISSGITNSVTDLVPESLRQVAAPIYTAPSQEGILNANDVPPFSTDIATFKNITFYANTRNKQNFSLTMLGVGGENGINFRAFYANISSGGNTISSIASTEGIIAGMLVDADVFSSTATVTAVSSSSIVVDLAATSTGSGTEFKVREAITIDGTEYRTQFGSAEYNNVNKSSGTTIANLSTTAGLSAGMAVTGTLIDADTTIATIVNSTSITLSKNTLGASSGGNIVITAQNNNSAGTFGVYTDGTPSQNIRETAENLVSVINRFSSNTSVDAFYTSGFGELPGSMLFRKKDFASSAFSITAIGHNNIAYEPALPSSGTSISSTNDRFLNGVYFSKVNEPEAVPTLNFFRIGSADEEVERIIPLRDGIFVFKQDGIYRITGEDPSSLRVDPFDLTVRITGPETAVPLNNLIFFLSDEGVCQMSESGVEVISRPIEEKVLNTFAVDDIENLAFALNYDSERRYILYLPQTNSDTSATIAYVYNVFTQAWTEWDQSKTTGFINPNDDKIWLGDAISNRVNVERKNRNFRDYADDETSVILTSAVSSTLTFNSFNGAGVTTGWAIVQSNTIFGIVSATNSSANEITLQSTGAQWLPQFSSTRAADTSTSSNSLTNLSSTTDLVPGQTVTGSGIPADTTITQIVSSTSVNISNTPTASATGVSITFSATGDAKFIAPIDVDIEFTSQFAGNPGVTKQFRDISLFFKELTFFNLDVLFTSDISRSAETVTLQQTGTGLWGLFPWGQQPWGGSAPESVVLRTYVPRDKQRCTQIFVRVRQSEAYATFLLQGISIFTNMVSERTRR